MECSRQLKGVIGLRRKIFDGDFYKSNLDWKISWFLVRNWRVWWEALQCFAALSVAPREGSLLKSKKIIILKSLAGSTWGQSKETLILTYKSIWRSVLEYAAPVWAPAISKSRWSDLQTVQNSALRIATGSLLMTNIDHLHIETKMLPLEIHSKIITKQYLASTHLPDHPGNKHLNRPQPLRQMKLQKSMNIYTEEVTHRFREQEPTKQDYKRVLKDYENRVLGQESPDQDSPNSGVAS